MLTGSKRTAGIVFAVLLVGVVVLVAATSGIGKPSLPNDDLVAYVEDAPDGEVTQEEFDAAIEQAAARQQSTRCRPRHPPVPPPEGDGDGRPPVSRLVAGEAEELGIEVSTPRSTRSSRRSSRTSSEVRSSSTGSWSNPPSPMRTRRQRVQLQLLSQRIQEETIGTRLGARHRRTRRSRTTTTRTSSSSRRPRPATCARSSTRTRPRPRRRSTSSRTTPARTGRRWRRSFRPTRPPQA